MRRSFRRKLRWRPGILRNPVFPTLPLGTLAANLTGGGYLVAVVVTLICRGEYTWALAHAAVLLGGSLVMTALGIMTFSLLKVKGGMMNIDSPNCPFCGLDGVLFENDLAYAIPENIRSTRATCWSFPSASTAVRCSRPLPVSDATAQNCSR